MQFIHIKVKRTVFVREGFQVNGNRQRVFLGLSSGPGNDVCNDE